MKFKFTKKQILKFFLIVVAYCIFLSAFFFLWKNGHVQRFIEHSKFLAPILYIGFASLKAIFPVIPGEVLVGMGAFLFGPILGLIYAVTGLTLGSSAAFFLARIYGRKFVKKLLGDERFNKVDKLSGDKTLFTFFLVYLTPGTPDDFVTYIAGLTKISFGWFLFICITGRLPSYLIYVAGGYSLKSMNIKLMIFLWALMFAVVGLILLIKTAIDIWQKKKNIKKS